MAKTDLTEMLPMVDPEQLEAAYIGCAHMITEIHPDGQVDAKTILEKRDRIQASMQDPDALDLFRRLCLLIQLVDDIDEHWNDYGFTAPRPEKLPSALFGLAGSEIAFEGAGAQHSATFFMRDVFDDAIAMFRPN